MTKKTRDRWQNLLMYVSANLESQETARSKEEAEDLHRELYAWLGETFDLRIKKKKPKFQLFKNH